MLKKKLKSMFAIFTVVINNSSKSPSNKYILTDLKYTEVDGEGSMFLYRSEAYLLIRSTYSICCRHKCFLK